jgi:aryl-alcohol dehydrogenase-like predicted oxidoreductase
MVTNSSSIAVERVPLGRTGIEISPVGLGTWQWGDTFFWDYGKGGFTDEDLREAFDATVDGGINFFDTAEIYGGGRSEQLLGQFIRDSGRAVRVASKFWPWPWRIGRKSLLDHLRKSLDRLQMDRLDLYMIHAPIPPIPLEARAQALADAVDQGLTRSVGVANYNLKQMRRTYRVLKERGIPLASNQVQYSLLHRDPERNGMLETCRKAGITLVAYSPLGMGLLTGKYSPENPPPGLRGMRFRRRLPALQPLTSLLQEIGQGHGGKTHAQVALNWVVCKGAVPIPGAKNVEQARQNAGAFGWRLTAEEVRALDAASDKIKVGI